MPQRYHTTFIYLLIPFTFSIYSFIYLSIYLFIDKFANLLMNRQDPPGLDAFILPNHALPLVQGSADEPIPEHSQLPGP